MKKEKYRQCEYTCFQYKKLFIENEHSEEEKNRKRQSFSKKYRTLSEEKKHKKCEYALEKNRGLFKEQKEKKASICTRNINKFF